MDSYVTGAAIKRLREEKNMTQADLAERLEVSPKTVSKWETGRGLPDVSLLDSLAAALGVSLIELMNGASIVNRNVSGNLLRAKFYCCPVCGNVLYALGEATVSCCGVLLPPLEAEEADEAHFVSVETVEDERFVSVRHEMSKQHYISFLAHVSTDRLQ
ncbi:MAG: helix-turn-helix domain-containing protein, partial [Oscillospiraceae bacterium]|nr:helix-turn-helix domain-containing protein [Oscillospiraceae bacterium]